MHWSKMELERGIFTYELTDEQLAKNYYILRDWWLRGHLSILKRLMQMYHRELCRREYEKGVVNED